MRAIILAAGNGYQLDGFNKGLINDPVSMKAIAELQLEAFDTLAVTMVVGYRAINIMNRYPNIDYVYNAAWSSTNNSYSLGLALTDEPCIVVSGDMMFDRSLVQKLIEGPADVVLTSNNENRTLNSLHCHIKHGLKVEEVYQGELRELSDPEAVGVFKVTSPALLREWKRNCIRHPNLFAGQNLAFHSEHEIVSLDLGAERLDEVNTVADYLRLLDKANRRGRTL